MEPIYSMTTLQRNPSVVKKDARQGVVRITEQGGRSYVFCSEEAFESRISKERAEAAYEARLMDAVGRGIADVEAGRFTSSVEEAFSKAEQLRKHYV